ncbi:hypothetical protein CYMTET_8961 [Cymbomonas tetramitiformis]|uniref:Uncharacterized protein n=1 Tax=Cymbomonas tetramitiformis TaxID=36881 RepID=A0AAE0LFZ6_9CHLO|nr:hypothetical protein CYMTET_8961 [Cymbomonas tetramitiformis]
MVKSSLPSFFALPFLFSLFATATSNTEATGQFCNLVPDTSGHFEISAGPYTTNEKVSSDILDFKQCSSLTGGLYVKFVATSGHATNLVELSGYSLYDSAQLNNVFVYGTVDDMMISFPTADDEIPDRETRVFYMHLASPTLGSADVKTGSSVIASGLGSGKFLTLTTEIDDEELDANIDCNFTSSANGKELASLSDTFADRSKNDLKNNNYYVILVGTAEQPSLFTHRGEPSFGERLVPSALLLFLGLVYMHLL